jgi:hypothetical protein
MLCDGAPDFRPPIQIGGPPACMGWRKSGAIRRSGRYADAWLPYMVDPVRLGESLTEVRDAAIAQGCDTEPAHGAVYACTCIRSNGGSRRAGWGIETVSNAYA